MMVLLEGWRSGATAPRPSPKYFRQTADVLPINRRQSIRASTSRGVARLQKPVIEPLGDGIPGGALRYCEAIGHILKGT